MVEDRQKSKKNFSESATEGISIEYSPPLEQLISISKEDLKQWKKDGERYNLGYLIAVISYRDYALDYLYRIKECH